MAKVTAPNSTRVVLSASVPSTEIRFGGVTVRAAVLPNEVADRNIKAGHAALSRAKGVLERAGVEVRVAAGVPLYHADPGAPEMLVRTLNGRTTRGRFVGGKFKPT